MCSPIEHDGYISFRTSKMCLNGIKKGTVYPLWPNNTAYKTMAINIINPHAFAWFTQNVGKHENLGTPMDPKILLCPVLKECIVLIWGVCLRFMLVVSTFF